MSLKRDLRILFATLALGCAADTDSGVRAAAVRTLGFAVTFNTLNDASFFSLVQSVERETIVFLSFWGLGSVLSHG